MKTGSNYYKVLGVAQNATKKEIDDAYKKLVLQFHPDVAKDKDFAEKKMREINEAYDTLKNEEKRKRYDEFITSGMSGDYETYEQSRRYSQHSDDFDGFSQGEFKFGDFFKAFFSSSNTSDRGEHNFTFGSSSGNKGGFFDNYDDMQNNTNGFSFQSNVNKKENISVTFEEWYCGSKKTISYERYIECKQCRLIKNICQTCKGAGARYNVFVTTICQSCGGNGYVLKRNPCNFCVKGCKPEKTTISFNIPRFTGPSVVLNGYGNYTGSEYGDLEIRISLIEHKVFSIKGLDIVANLNITLKEFCNGATIKFVYLDNTKLVINLPKFSDRQIVFKEKGVKQGKSSGNLVLNIKVICENDEFEKIKHIVSSFKDIDDPLFKRDK